MSIMLTGLEIYLSLKNLEWLIFQMEWVGINLKRTKEPFMLR